MKNPETLPNTIEEIARLKEEYIQLNTPEHKALEAKLNAGTITPEENEIFDATSEQLTDLVVKVATIEKENGVHDNFDWVMFKPR